MTYKQFRDLYPIVAFDLTAQTMKVRNTKVTFSVVGNRNSNTPLTLNMYIIVLFEKFYEANYLENSLQYRSSPMDMSMNKTAVAEGAGIYLP